MSTLLVTLYVVYLVAAAIAVLWLGVEVAEGWLAERRRDRERILVRYSVRQLLTALLIDERDHLALPLWQSVGRYRLLAELIAELTAVTYGLDPASLRRVVVAYGLDHWVLGRIRRARGDRRAAWLRLLADLPHRREVSRAVAIYGADRSRAVRFATLLVQLTAHPEEVLRLIADFREPFTPIEVAEVLHLLRRGLLPIAYRPLLEATNENLQLIGLEIVAQFGIEEVDADLVRLATEGGGRVARRALRVLARLHRPLRRRELVHSIRRMADDERHALLRLLAREAYAAEQVRTLVAQPEIPYYESLIGSYKRSLVCM